MPAQPFDESKYRRKANGQFDTKHTQGQTTGIHLTPTQPHAKIGRLTPADRQTIARAHENAGRDPKDAQWLAGRADGYATVGNVLVTVGKPHIQKEFWYAEHGYDWDEAQAKARGAETDQDNFIRENLAQTESARWLEAVGKGHRPWTESVPPQGDGPVAGECFVNLWGRDPDPEDIAEREGKAIHMLDEEETRQMVEFHQAFQAAFEKRLRTYLKRYGMEHVRGGTYWADR